MSQKIAKQHQKHLLQKQHTDATLHSGRGNISELIKDAADDKRQHNGLINSLRKDDFEQTNKKNLNERHKRRQGVAHHRASVAQRQLAKLLPV